MRTKRRPTFRLTPLAVLALLLAAALRPGATAAADEVTTLEIGAAAPDFKLPGVDGRDYTLADFADAQVLVVVFTCNHCPTAQAYEQRIIQMHEDYKDKGVALVAISPNDPLAVRLDELGYTDLGDSFEDMKIRAEHRGFQFPYLYDGDTQQTSRAYGAVATPHVFVFDKGRKLRYAGRVDDSETKPDQVKSHDARNAIDALLAGEPVAVEKTNVFGCSTKWSDKRNDVTKARADWEKQEVSLADIDADGIKALSAFEPEPPAAAEPGADAAGGEGAAAARGPKLRLVNVWATWCGPCVTELPELVTISQMYHGRGLEVVTISMDEAEDREAALDMLKEKHVAATNYIWAGENRDDLVSGLDAKWQGPVPHTILIAPGGEVLYRESGAFDALELKRAIVDYLGRTY